jgi:hypothetical protein
MNGYEKLRYAMLIQVFKDYMLPDNEATVVSNGKKYKHRRNKKVKKDAENFIFSDQFDTFVKKWKFNLNTEGVRERLRSGELQTQYTNFFSSRDVDSEEIPVYERKK